MKKKLRVTALALVGAVLIGASGIAVYNARVAGTETVAVAVISQGSRGDTVKLIQKKLKRWGYYNGSVDGIYGAQTKAAVKYFQSKNGLVADGVVGEKTLAALGISQSVLGSTNQTDNSGSYSNTDVNLLARLIYGEARGESFTGQVAVGAVVMNRVKSSSFPNTVSGVIYQPYAFTAVADGQINLSPDATAIKAAKQAMNGYDPSYGALYYYNPSTATSSWIFSRKTIVTIGNHVFAK